MSGIMHPDKWIAPSLPIPVDQAVDATPRERPPPLPPPFTQAGGLVYSTIKFGGR